ncbi:hypothetical protein BC628DRAFT_727647 [Trametes gibbosa]|nr:hypothetical protein BC628DRAFT_727647 [Trametes gibbosa]
MRLPPLRHRGSESTRTLEGRTARRKVKLRFLSSRSGSSTPSWAICSPSTHGRTLAASVYLSLPPWALLALWIKFVGRDIAYSNFDKSGSKSYQISGVQFCTAIYHSIPTPFSGVKRRQQTRFAIKRSQQSYQCPWLITYVIKLSPRRGNLSHARGGACVGPWPCAPPDAFLSQVSTYWACPALPEAGVLGENTTVGPPESLVPLPAARRGTRVLEGARKISCPLAGRREASRRRAALLSSRTFARHLSSQWPRRPNVVQFKGGFVGTISEVADRVRAWIRCTLTATMHLAFRQTLCVPPWDGPDMPNGTTAFPPSVCLRHARERPREQAPSATGLPSLRRNGHACR